MKAAERKARDPNMSVNGNPLRKEGDPEAPMVEKHMKDLMCDAAKWNDPKSGHIYRAIRSMTYQGGE